MFRFNIFIEFLGDFMVLNYIYGIVMIHLLPINTFMSMDLKIKVLET